MPTFRPDALVFLRAKVRSFSEHLFFIAMRRIICCHRKLRGSAPPRSGRSPLLPSSQAAAIQHPVSCHPASSQLQSPISVEGGGGGGVEQPNVDCLLQQQLLGGPVLINHCGLLPLDRVMALPCMLCKRLILQCPLLTALL